MNTRVLHLRLPALLPTLLAGVLLLLAQAPAPAQGVRAITGENDRRLILVLIRSTLVALHQANVTGNYSVLRDLSAGSLRNKTSDADLAAAFQPLRKAGIDLAAAAILQPQLSQDPTIDDTKTLRVQGTLETRPSPVAFSLTFQPEESVWRIAGLSVKIQPTAAAPQESAPAPAVSQPAAADATPTPAAAKPAPAKPATPKPGAAAKPATPTKPPPAKGGNAPAPKPVVPATP